MRSSSYISVHTYAVLRRNVLNELAVSYIDIYFNWMQVTYYKNRSDQASIFSISTISTFLLNNQQYKIKHRYIYLNIIAYLNIKEHVLASVHI